MELPKDRPQGRSYPTSPDHIDVPPGTRIDMPQELQGSFFSAISDELADAGRHAAL